ncbi:hypothetical protein SDJN03_17019, partial [Cucurbita argyrosperma subsp. sororia]
MDIFASTPNGLSRASIIFTYVPLFAIPGSRSQVDGYLHNEEEKHYKKIIWEEMNREYLEEQAAKDAAAAAAKNAYEANFQNCSADLKAAKDLADAAAAAVAKSRKVSLVFLLFHFCHPVI